jgi:hypothetical protein
MKWIKRIKWDLVIAWILAVAVGLIYLQYQKGKIEEAIKREIKVEQEEKGWKIVGEDTIEIKKEKWLKQTKIRRLK